MEWILLFPLGAMAGTFVGGIFLGCWCSLALLFGIHMPSEEQVQGVLLGSIMLSQIGVGGVCVYAALES